MPKISSYPKDDEITAADILVGSDGNNALITKNFSVGDLLSYIETTGTFIQDTFTYTQAVSSSLWVISHGLGTFPSVTIIDSSGNNVFGDIVYNNQNTLTLTFSAAFTGAAYLN
jgi:hypothetical protein